MKKKILLMCTFATLLFTMPVFAEVKNTNTISVGESDVLPIGYETTTGTSNKNGRGAFLSTGMVSLSQRDPKGMDLFATTLCHEPVDKIFMRLTVECMDEETGLWSTVDSRDITFTKEETEGDLTSPIVSYSIVKQSKRYYRLRCMHLVTLNGVTESLTSYTDWLYIY